MSTYTHKTSFQKVFQETQAQLDRLQKLLIKCNGIHMHTTHFSKYYLLNCPPTDQIPLHKQAFEVIASELNKTDNSVNRGGSDRTVLVNHFLPYIKNYKQLINYDGEGIKYFKQLATYMSETFETNIKVNVHKEILLKKFNTLITRIVVEQIYLPQIPRNLPDVERQNLKKLKGICTLIILGKDFSLPENLHLDDQVLTAHILAILPQQIIANGIPRDITTRPEAYLNSPIELSRLFDQYDLKAFNAIPLSTSTIPRYLIIDSRGDIGW